MKEKTSFVHQLARLLNFGAIPCSFPAFSTEGHTPWSCSRCFRGRVSGRHVERFSTCARQNSSLQTFAEGVASLLWAARCNLLARDRIPYFEKLAEYASCTLERLPCLEFGIPDLVVELFRPQPDLWLQMPFVPRQGSFPVGGRNKMLSLCSHF